MTSNQETLWNKFHVDFITAGNLLITELDEQVPPETAKERYQLFKNYAAKWFFLYYKSQYQKVALTDTDIHSIKSQLAELDNFLKHEQLNDQNKHKLYKEAQKYLLHHYSKESGNYSPEQVELFSYILHYNGYFENCDIPDKAISIYAHNILAKIYGKYFLFYEFLKSKIVELEPSDLHETGEKLITPELNTIVNKYVLLDQLGIIQFLKDNHGFDKLKQVEKIALLSMILGLDKKGEHSIKGILSSPRPTDKNYPLKDKNIKTVQSKLIELGINKAKPIKGLGKR